MSHLIIWLCSVNLKKYTTENLCISDTIPLAVVSPRCQQLLSSMKMHTTTSELAFTFTVGY